MHRVCVEKSYNSRRYFRRSFYCVENSIFFQRFTLDSEDPVIPDNFSTDVFLCVRRTLISYSVFHIRLSLICKAIKAEAVLGIFILKSDTHNFCNECSAGKQIKASHKSIG